MKALIIGATGLVGKEILKRTLEDSRFVTVDIFVRRPAHVSHKKLREHVVNFDDINAWKDSLKGDVLFSALGTTLKAAGSQEGQYGVDFEYQYQVSKACRENGTRFLVLVSSVGADSDSPFFYLRTKGELEAAVMDLGFEGVTILRPSFLEGEREVNRPGDKVVQLLLGKIPKTKLLARLLPVSARQVAFRALAEAGNFKGTKVLEPRDIL